MHLGVCVSIHLALNFIFSGVVLNVGLFMSESRNEPGNVLCSLSQSCPLKETYHSVRVVATHPNCRTSTFRKIHPFEVLSSKFVNPQFTSDSKHPHAYTFGLNTAAFFKSENVPGKDNIIRWFPKLSIYQKHLTPHLSFILRTLKMQESIEKNIANTCVSVQSGNTLFTLSSIKK